MSAVNLNALSSQQLHDLFSAVDTVLCDNDGVLSYNGTLLPGVSKCICRFREAGKEVKVITNNCAIGRDAFSATFRKQGFLFDSDDFITPTCAMTNYLRGINFRDKVWINSYEGMTMEFKRKGFDVADSENPRIVPLSETHNYIVGRDPRIKAIVVDNCLNTTSGCLMKAIHYLNDDPDVLLLFGSTDAAIPIGKGIVIMGSKYFQDIIVEMTGRKPLIFGKPSVCFGKYLIDTLRCNPSRTLFIGDNLASDIGFAKRQGFKQLLVLSGLTKLEDMESCKEEFRPDYYVSSLEELNTLLCSKVAEACSEKQLYPV